MDKNSELARERTAVIRATDFEDAVRIVGNIMNEKPGIKPEWIKEFFVKNDLNDVPIESIHIDGYLSPQALANFLNRKIGEEKEEK